MQDAPKAVWSIPYVSVAFFPSLKKNFIAYCSSKVSSWPNCIFGIHQLWQSGFSRAYSNCCCSCSFEPEIIKVGQSSHMMYSNNILNFQESKTILNARTKKSWNLLNAPYIYIYIYIYIFTRGAFNKFQDFFCSGIYDIHFGMSPKQCQLQFFPMECISIVQPGHTKYIKLKWWIATIIIIICLLCLLGHLWFLLSSHNNLKKKRKKKKKKKKRNFCTEHIHY